MGIDLRAMRTPSYSIAGIESSVDRVNEWIHMDEPVCSVGLCHEFDLHKRRLSMRLWTLSTHQLGWSSVEARDKTQPSAAVPSMARNYILLWMRIKSESRALNVML